MTTPPGSARREGNSPMNSTTARLTIPNMFDTDDTLCSAPECPLTPILGEHLPGEAHIDQTGPTTCITDLP
jgi:hypothetical protein